MKKALIIGFLVLFMAGCAKEKSDIEKAKDMLSEKALTEDGIPYTPDEVREKVLEVINKKPEDCDANYLLLLADVKIIFETINPIIGVLQSLSSFTQQAGGMVDSIVSSIVPSFLELFDEMDKAVEVIEKNNCSLILDNYKITLGLEDSPILSVAFKGYDPRKKIALPGEWDITEADLIGSFVSIVKAGLHFILSLDLDLNLEEVLNAYNEGIISLSMEDPVGLIRSLGFVADKNPNFLNFHPDRKELYALIGQDYSTSLKRISTALNELLKPDENPYDDILGWVDNGLKINAFDPETGERGIFIKIGDREIDALDILENVVFKLLPITEDYIKTVVDTTSRWSRIFSGELKEPISITELTPLLFGLIEFKDTIRVSPWKLYPSSITEAKPVREFLPYWADTNDDGYAEFMVEGELPSQYANQATSYLFVGDSVHFEDYPDGITIPEDCFYPSSITFVYIAFKDPTFNGAVEVNLDPVKANICNEEEYLTWKPADNFSLNVVINDLIDTFLGLLSQVQGLF
jgi:hypothetical protein